MIIFLIALTVIVISFGCFSLAYQINGLNRLIIYTPNSIVETSTYVDGEHAYSFPKEHIEAEFSLYLEPKIERYTKNYQIEYYFYNQFDHSYCIQEYCDALQIHVAADLMFNYKYSRKIFFEIKENYGF